MIGNVLLCHLILILSFTFGSIAADDAKLYQNVPETYTYQGLMLWALQQVIATD